MLIKSTCYLSNNQAKLCILEDKNKFELPNNLNRFSTSLNKIIQSFAVKHVLS